MISSTHDSLAHWLWNCPPLCYPDENVSLLLDQSGNNTLTMALFKLVSTFWAIQTWRNYGIDIVHSNDKVSKCFPTADPRKHVNKGVLTNCFRKKGQTQICFLEIWAINPIAPIFTRSMMFDFVGVRRFDKTSLVFRSRCDKENRLDILIANYTLIVRPILEYDKISFMWRLERNACMRMKHWGRSSWKALVFLCNHVINVHSNSLGADIIARNVA